VSDLRPSALDRGDVVVAYGDSPHSWPPLTPLDWIAISQRWLWLGALPLVAGLAGALSRPLIVLSLGWMGFALAVSLARVVGAGSPRVVYAAAGVDIAFAVGALALSGGAVSPLWWSLLIGAVGVALLEGAASGIRATAISIVSGVLLTTAAGGGAPALPGVLVQGAVLALAAVPLLLMAGRVRREARSVGRRQGVDLREIRKQDRERLGRFFRQAGRLAATLDHERVLDQALDLAAEALLDPDDHPDQLVGLLLLAAGDRARIVAGRGLPPADWRLDFRVDRGLIGRALTGRQPLQTRAARDDPDLRRLEGLAGSRALLAAPLAHGGERIGVMLFGHPNPNVFGQAQRDLLAAMAEQTMIALQHSRRFQDLTSERERIQELQEEARRRLARDLHDGPTQSLATIAMRASFARRLLGRDPAAAEAELGRAEDLARRTTREVRHMLFTLRPLVLESQGLISALQQLAGKTRDLTGHEVILELEDEQLDGLSSASQSLVFFIAEEAVHNARKHAEAEHVWIRMRRQAERLVMEVEDDGVGFNVGAVDASYAQRGSLGMVSMRERTELLGGELTVESAEGRGTTVRLTVPLAPGGDGDRGAAGRPA
jgi:signal transduction histidine kinase